MGVDEMKVLLFSGGIDSSALGAWLRPDVLCTIDYGQRVAAAEIRAATYIAERLDIKHEILSIDCSGIGSGHLAGQEPSSLAGAPEWWPYRNQLLVTLAGMRFVSHGLSEILVGTVSGDSRHMDGRPEFVSAMSSVMQVQEGNVKISAPAMAMSAEDLVARSGLTSDVLAYTFSCHISVHPCGQCRGCIKHAEVLAAF